MTNKMPNQITEQIVLDFWFQELGAKKWFAVSEEIDSSIRERFSIAHEMAVQGDLLLWRTRARGALAEIIVLDQFSRNMFRNQAKAFASDEMALTLAQEAVTKGLDRELVVAERRFIYMPYMHSESLKIHEEAVQLFSQPSLEENLKFELRHKEIIEKFGRYPHRNKILGRISTPEEIEFLKTPGSSF